MNLLFFDTETTGLPRSWRAPITDVNNWPRLVQIAWIQVSTTPEWTERTFNHIIRPDGFEIPEQASKVHGITTERAYAEGKNLKLVLDVFALRLRECDVVICHNYEFDKAIVGCEFHRAGIPDLFRGKKYVCTMKDKDVKKYVDVRNTKGNLKWPTNQELHKKLFGTEFDGAHDARADIEATKRSFFELVRLSIPKEFSV